MSFKKRHQRSCPFSLSASGRHPEGGSHLRARRRSVPRTQPCWNLDLRLPASRAVRKQIPMVCAMHLQCHCYGSLSKPSWSKGISHRAKGVSSREAAISHLCAHNCSALYWVIINTPCPDHGQLGGTHGSLEQHVLDASEGLLG